MVFGLALAVFAGSGTQERVMAVSRYTLLTAAVLILCSVSLLISAWGDPKSIGPIMALGLLSLLYGSVIHTCAQVVYRVSSGESLPHTTLKNLALSVSAMLVIVGSYLILANITS